ncbi:hypothetical protein Lcho_1660 [Leptothrix cholodnii SP-6]|uniref:Lipoprotein n=1 Tax=Leptothrix cholodnii (strain ATCC 51168 / LMG 8142 / SP-6) TaxID=395495 RepID=B1XY26_LEPCP|nr:hypothetical protein [Leptothrix cholodnii]ACB33927.1 hypothetical protein Lcho_1660 [Leptothrix cholodnii SP-6]
MNPPVKIHWADAQARAVSATRRGRLAIALAAVSALGGCAVVSAAASVAGAAVSVTATVVTTGAKVVGAVVEKTVDVVAGDEPAPAAATAAASAPVASALSESR